MSSPRRPEATRRIALRSSGRAIRAAELKIGWTTERSDLARYTRAIAVSLSLWLLSSLAWGRLVAISWHDFVNKTELVVRARLAAGEIGSSGAGHARFEVLKVLLGRSDRKEIEISWSSEVHDQAATNLGGEYVLFLKSDDHGQLGPAIYGRSFWPIEWHVLPSGEFKQLIEYRNPVSKVVLPESMLVTIRVTDSGPTDTAHDVRGIDPAALEELLRDVR